VPGCVGLAKCVVLDSQVIPDQITDLQTTKKLGWPFCLPFQSATGKIDARWVRMLHPASVALYMYTNSHACTHPNEVTFGCKLTNTRALAKRDDTGNINDQWVLAFIILAC